MRQTSTPVDFELTTRPDMDVGMTSGFAGKVVPLGYVQLYPGDSCSGSVGLDLKLAEMPRPLLNQVNANFQAWFIPKLALPQFPGRDELQHSMIGDPIKSLGAADRTPPPYYTMISGANFTTAIASELLTTLGLHFPTGGSINSDLIDSFVLLWNFRAAAYSKNLTRRQYAAESIAAACALPPAFWPPHRMSHVVGDYEAALVQGSLDLDVVAGQLPVTGINFLGSPAAVTAAVASRGVLASHDRNTDATDVNPRGGAGDNGVVIQASAGAMSAVRPEIYAQMAGQRISITLNDIDKARVIQAYAKLNGAYAGNDSTGFDNDNVLVALLMQGLDPGQEAMKRPVLLDSARVPVGFSERFATDAANLDDSVTVGRASATMNLNVPRTDHGGYVIYTVEVMPDRIDERMADERMMYANFDQLPNALRDIRRTLPVDVVLNRQLDAKHATPSGQYGFEPMNYKHRINRARLGGVFYQATPGTTQTQARFGLWQHEIVNPALTSSHYIAPQPFPQDVFAVQTEPCFECTTRHMVSIVGNTQMGDVLLENNSDYAQVLANGV